MTREGSPDGQHRRHARSTDAGLTRQPGRPEPARRWRTSSSPTCARTASSSPSRVIVVLFSILTNGILLHAAEHLQPHRAERLHPDPRDRHGDRDHRRAHRPVGRIGRRLHRRGLRRRRGARWSCRGGSRSSPLVVGALVGAWQGFWIAFVGIPAFIVTLAGMLIFRGARAGRAGQQQIIGRSRRSTATSATASPTGLLGGVRARHVHPRPRRCRRHRLRLVAVAGPRPALRYGQDVEPVARSRRSSSSLAAVVIGLRLRAGHLQGHARSR